MDTLPDRHSSNLEWFWCELQLLRENHDVWRHPLYARWSAGSLGQSELPAFVEEYDHLIVATAAATRRAADKASGVLGDALSAHAEREEAKIDEWRAYAAASGWSCDISWYYGTDPGRATVECARVWAGKPSRSLALDLVTLCAIHGPSNELSQDRRAVAESALALVIAGEDPFGLLAQAGAVRRAHWNMLDAVEQQRLVMS